QSRTQQQGSSSSATCIPPKVVRREQMSAPGLGEVTLSATGSGWDDARPSELPIVDGDPAPFLRCDVAQRLGERPPVAGGIEEGALPLAVPEILRLAEDRATVPAHTFAQGRDVVDSKHHRLRGLLGGRCCTAVTDIGHDQRSVAEAE